MSNPITPELPEEIGRNINQINALRKIERWVEFRKLLKNVLAQKDAECERRVEEARKELIAELVRWMRMENSVAVVHREQWNEFIKSLTQPKGT